MLPEHYIYALECRDDGSSLYVKVGESAIVLARLQQISVACPVLPFRCLVAGVGPYVRTARLIEKELHRELRSFWHHGEWFKVAPALMLKWQRQWEILSAKSWQGRLLQWVPLDMGELAKYWHQLQAAGAAKAIGRKRRFGQYRNLKKQTPLR